jgi:hypothetical protein
MKTKSLFSFAVLALLISGFTYCSSILFFKEGTSMTMTSYDKDGKITGSSKMDFIKVYKTDSGQKVDVSQEFFDKKGKAGNKNNYSIRCFKDILYFDMKMIAGQQAEAFKDMEMTMEGAELQIPASLTVGQSLPDANVKMTMSPKGSSPMPIMTVSIKISNRKVEAKESITTTAGTFECYKITEDAEVNSIFKMKTRSVNWFSYEAGNVKTESYKDNGKLMAYTLLTELKK